MVMKRRFRAATMVVSDPFRITEFLVAIPMFLYGLYLLTPLNTPVPGGFFERFVDPELYQTVNGIVYALVGTAMYLAAQSGSIRGRRVSTMLFFSAMLYSMVIRAVEYESVTTSMIFIWIALVLAGVDYANVYFRWRNRLA